MRTRLLLALAIAAATSSVLAGQTQPAPATPPAPGSLPAVIGAERSQETATVTFTNRSIVELKARVLGRSPGERATGAERSLDDLVNQGITGPVESSVFEGGAMIRVANRGVLALTNADIDDLAGETIEGVTAQTVARMQQALAEAGEARAPGIILRAAMTALAALALSLLALWAIRRAQFALGDRLTAMSEQKLSKSGLADLESLRSSRLLEFQRGAITTIAVLLELIVTYSVVTFVLRQFPYTRPWGESLSGYLLTTVETLGLGIVNGIPGVFTVILIFLIARFVVRILGVWFQAVERGRVRVRWLYPETAQPTRRLATGLIWVFAIVVAYPYMPGSQTDAFKGVSVFLGLMITLGSSGLVNHIMSGFMITYSRALREGDFVKVGDVEGTVMHVGVLSVKVRTVWNEEVTIPNAVVVSQTATDYSRPGNTEGVFTLTSVTIGYDAPWRQVQSLLLLAAERTPGLRQHPKPRVLQTGLQDFYVQYTLLVALERQDTRPVTLHQLHANIQDLFNEYGVQIMSPNYMLDPSAPKVVSKQNWFAAPARPEGKD